MVERIAGLAHCCHHDKHWEYCYNYEERVSYIKNNKPQSEQELRLKLFFIVPDDKVPGHDSPEREAYDKAREAYSEAWEAYRKAWEAYRKAGEAYDKAWEAYSAKYKEELDALCKELCPDCTWREKQ